MSGLYAYQGQLVKLWINPTRTWNNVYTGNQPSCLGFVSTRMLTEDGLEFLRLCPGSGPSYSCLLRPAAYGVDFYLRPITPEETDYIVRMLSDGYTFSGRTPTPQEIGSQFFPRHSILRTILFGDQAIDFPFVR
jgi:hypothetical protein